MSLLCYWRARKCVRLCIFEDFIHLGCKRAVLGAVGFVYEEDNDLAINTICYNTAPTGISTSGAAGSGSFTYQWYYEAGSVTPTSGSIAGWTSITGQTGTSLTASAITANTTYACWVTPGGTPTCGTVNWAGASNNDKIQITVEPTLSYGTASTSGATTICYNTAPTGISTSGGSGGSGTFTYQWYYEAGFVTPTSGSTAGWTSITGQTGTSLTASAITANTTYACWVIPGGTPNCGSANWAGASNNDNIQITLEPALSYGTASTSGATTICYNTAPAGISTSGGSGGSGTFTYQWYYEAGLVAPTPGSTTGWTSISGQTGTSLTATAITASTTYACWVTPGGTPNCGSANWAGASNNDNIQITVEPTVSYGTASDASGNTQTICYNTAPLGNMVASGATGSASFSYQWYYQSGIVTAPTGSSTSGWTACGSSQGSGYNTATYTASAITDNTTYACYLTPGGSPTCGTATWAAGAIQITVTPNNTISLSSDEGTDAQTVCMSTTITPITYNTTGATNASYSGLPTGVNGNWLSNVVTISGSPSVSGTFNYKVTLTGGCGNITANGSITVNPLPTPTFTTSPGANSCALTSVTYTTQSGQYSYNWNVPGSPGTDYTITSGGISGTDYTVTLTWLTTGSKIVTVNYNNSYGCTGATAATNTTMVNPATPATPGSITGTTPQCYGATGQNYSISPVTNATTYTWTVPGGWSITAGNGTTSMTTDVGLPYQNGSITVTAGNSCGTSAASSKAVTVVATPSTPGAISGTTTQCAGQTGENYYISGVTFATIYNWSVPTGWIITSGAGTTSIYVTTGGAGQSGNISVTAGNSMRNE